MNCLMLGYKLVPGAQAPSMVVHAMPDKINVGGMKDFWQSCTDA